MTTQPPPNPPPAPGGAIRPSLLFVGGGNMATAILRGGIAACVIEPSRVMVLEPDQSKHAALHVLGVRVSPVARDAIAWLNECDADAERSSPMSEVPHAAPHAAQLFLCVKPQMLRQAAADVRAAFDAPRVVVSILAGTPSSVVRRALGEHARVVRAMPNLAASIAQGVTAICRGDGANAGDDAAAWHIFESVGPIVMRLDEAHFDAFTALAGSGPAYLFYLAQGMIEGGVRAGLSREHARDATIQTLLGAAMLLARSDQSPGELRGAVTSKGGTTAAAVGVLDEHKALSVIGDAIVAGAARGAELAKLADSAER